MSEMQAALGRSQLRRLEENLARRRENFTALKNALAGISRLHVLDATDRSASNSHYCLIAALKGAAVKDRNQLIALLNARGVGTSIYYPQPVPRMAYYRKKYSYDASRFTGAESISDAAVALPVGPHIGKADVQYMADTFRSAVQEVGL
jgi:dTDP-4-amino-4,6-dideoxygalactose transaminase